MHSARRGARELRKPETNAGFFQYQLIPRFELGELGLLRQKYTPAFAVQLVPVTPVGELRLFMQKRNPVSAVQFSPVTLVGQIRPMEKD